MRCACLPLKSGFLYQVEEVPPELVDAVQKAYFRQEGERFIKHCPADARAMAAVAPVFARCAPDAFAAGGARWKSALHEFHDKAHGDGIDYTIFGSAALALQGYDVAPHDIDILTADADFCRIQALFADSVVEPFWDYGDALLLVRYFGRLCLASTWMDVSAGPKVALRIGGTERIVWEGITLCVQTADACLAAYDASGQKDRADSLRAGREKG